MGGFISDTSFDGLNLISRAHRSGLVVCVLSLASLLHTIISTVARREMHGGLVAARRTGDSRAVPNSAEVHGQTGRVRSAASSLRDGCRRRTAYRVVRCSSEVSTCSSASSSSATAGTVPARSSRTCIQVGALMWYLAGFRSSCSLCL